MKKILIFWFVLGVILILGFTFRSETSYQLSRLKRVHAPKGYTGILQDPIEQHLAQAECWNKNTGAKLPSDQLSPLNAIDHIGLKYIKSSNTYSVGWMEYSVPFLFTEAHAVLEEIAQEVQDRIKRKNLPSYKIRVTSLIRSKSSQKRLTQNDLPTPYWYGYTFSVSHHNFFKVNLFRQDIDGRILKETLERVLTEKRQANKILVHSGTDSTFFTITLRCPNLPAP